MWHLSMTWSWETKKERGLGSKQAVKRTLIRMISSWTCLRTKRWKSRNKTMM